MEEYCLDIFDIVSFLGHTTFANNERCLREGRILSRSKHHFVVFGVSHKADTSWTFKACCLTSQLNEKPHDLTIVKHFKDSGIQLQCSCSCKANIDRCKHIVAFLLKLEKELSAEIPFLSKTETEKQWGKLSEKRLQTKQPSRISDLCHVRKTERKYKQLPTELSSELNSFILQELTEGFPQSILALSVATYNDNLTTEPQQNSNQLVVDHHDVLQPLEEAIFNVIFGVENGLDGSFFLLHSCEQDLINYYYSNVAVTRSEAESLCVETKLQNNTRCKLERKKRITGSTAYNLYTYSRNKNPAWEQKLQNLLFTTFRGNKHTRFGKRSEKTAKQIFQRDSHARLINDVGLIVKLDKPWLGFSPDGFAQCADDENNFILLEIKALQKGKEFSGLELCKKLSFLTVEGDVVKMKERSMYYGQIQLGLAVCNLQKAKLLLYSEFDRTVTTVDVPINLEFVNCMIDSVTRTYFSEYLPFLYKNKDKL